MNAYLFEIGKDKHLRIGCRPQRRRSPVDQVPYSEALSRALGEAKKRPDPA